MRRQWVKFCMICLWYGRNSQPILRENYILFLIGIKCLTFIKINSHDDIVKKRRHKIRDMIIIFRNRIKWGGYQNLHDSFFWLKWSWQTISIEKILIRSYLYAQAISKILYDMPLVWEKFSAYSPGIQGYITDTSNLLYIAAHPSDRARGA